MVRAPGVFLVKRHINSVVTTLLTFIYCTVSAPTVALMYRWRNVFWHISFQSRCTLQKFDGICERAWCGGYVTTSNRTFWQKRFAIVDRFVWHESDRRAYARTRKPSCKEVLCYRADELFYLFLLGHFHESSEKHRKTLEEKACIVFFSLFKWRTAGKNNDK